MHYGGNWGKIGEGDPYRYQNLVYCSLGHDPPLQKNSSESIHNFLDILRTDEHRPTHGPLRKHDLYGGDERDHVIVIRHRPLLQSVFLPAQTPAGAWTDVAVDDDGTVVKRP